MAKPAPGASFTRVVEELVRRSNEEIRRIRDMEQRVDGAEVKGSTLEQLILEKSKKLDERADELEKQLKELSDEVFRVRTMLEKITKQLDRFASKTEVRELENAFNLISIERHPRPLAKPSEA